MLIEPNTYVRLIKNCPLDNSYEHTIIFNSREDQSAYFKSLGGKNFNKHSYQRYSKGVLSVQATMGEIYDCNYMMFNNEAFENKMFYAFVTRVEYVNNVTCRVYYALDVMQTWHFEYNVRECMVLREHTATDNIGDNIVPESLELGPYVYSGYSEPTRIGVDGKTYSPSELCILIAYNPALLDLRSLISDIVELDPDLTADIKSNFYGGVYQGINLLVAKSNDPAVIKDLMNSTDFLSLGGVVGATMFPMMFIPKKTDAYNEYNDDYEFTLERNTDFEGFTPNNNKLFTHPYTSAHLTSHRGNGNDFAFEYFTHGSEDGIARFVANCTVSASPSLIAYPALYKGEVRFLDGAVEIPSYPICNWGQDGVTEWINNNLFKCAASVGMSGLSAFTAPATTILPKATHGAVSARSAWLSGIDVPTEDRSSYARTVANDEVMNQVARAVPSMVSNGSYHNGGSNDSLFGIRGGRTIAARVKHITAEYAKRIDAYFDRFGYAVNKIKVPNRDSRAKWNYVRTAGCSIYGSIPADDAGVICSIYDRGITFWKPGVTIGVYDGKNNKAT